MPTIELPSVPRKAMTIFYVLDTSGSMGGTPIATLNSAMEETIAALKQQAKSNGDAQLKIAVLEFNSGCKWLNPSGPEDMEDFMWEELSAGGLTDVGAALLELDSKLSRKAFLNSITGNYLPIIIFMTDGYATDPDVYPKALTQIRENKWFRRAIKIGFALGDDPDKKMISEVVGNSEAVINTSDLSLFSKLIKYVSVTSSMLVSTSRTTAAEVTGATIVEGMIKTGEAPEDVVDTSVKYNPEPPAPPKDSDDEWGEAGW